MRTWDALWPGTVGLNAPHADGAKWAAAEGQLFCCFVSLFSCTKKGKEEAGERGGCVYKVADLTCDTFCQRVSMGCAFCLLLLALEAVKRLGPHRTLGSLLSVCVCSYVCVYINPKCHFTLNLLIMPNVIRLGQAGRTTPG